MENNNNQLQPSISFAPTVQPQSTQAMAVVAREAQEMQAAVYMARQFPRDPGRCLQTIEGDCTRITLAEKACYEYPKGGQTVTGASIRLAEVLAQRWGNIDTGWKITDRSRHDETGCEAWCWDLETNTRKRITYVVTHVLDTKKGPKVLTESRDIYELIANQSSRRQRNCILAIIPGDVIEAAVNKCRSTIANAGDIEKRRIEIVKMLGEFDVTPEAIEKRLGKKISAMSGTQYAQLRNIVTSLKDGVSKPSDWFEDILNPEKIIQEQKAVATEKPKPLAHETKAADDERESALMDFDEMVQQYASKKRDVHAELKRVNSSITVFSIQNLPPDRIRAATKFLGDNLK